MGLTEEQVWAAQNRLQIPIVYRSGTSPGNCLVDLPPYNCKAKGQVTDGFGSAFCKRCGMQVNYDICRVCSNRYGDDGDYLGGFIEKILSKERLTIKGREIARI